MTIKHLVMYLSFLSEHFTSVLVNNRDGECLNHGRICNLIRYLALSDISDILISYQKYFYEFLRRRSSGDVRCEITGQFLSVVI